MKREIWNIGNSLKTRPNFSKQDHSIGTLLGEFTPAKLGFFLVKLTQASINLPRQEVI